LPTSIVSASAELAELLGGPVLETAPRLLNAVLRHGEVAVRLTEVEAYDGANDPGSHAFRGRTPRNSVMFGPPGHLYCYFTYGMHVCCNVVCGPEGSASAVLIRAGEVVDGLAQARARRPGSSDRDLARGPARLCRALGIELAHDGTDLASGPVTLTLGEAASGVSTGPRVGLRGAPDRPWRFWSTGNPTVSPYRPAAPRRRRPAPEFGG
jgi:DNA-3-methyladenine glycosylase